MNCIRAASSSVLYGSIFFLCDFKTFKRENNGFPLVWADVLGTGQKLEGGRAMVFHAST